MEITGAEFRVFLVRRSWVGLSHLDSVERVVCRVARADRLIEGEIVSLGPVGRGGRREVVRSRIDPGYGPGPRYRLREYSLPECTPALGPYFALVEPVSENTVIRFYHRLPPFPIQRTKYQVGICRRMIEGRPLWILPLHRLGEIEWIRGRREKALKYLQAAWKLGLAAIPAGLKGTIDARNGSNAPLFMVATDLMKALAHFDRDDEALAVFHALDPFDKSSTWDAVQLLVPLLLRARRGAELGGILGTPNSLKEHEFVRALMLFLEGREAEAVRAICRGMRANPLMLTSLLERQRGALDVPFLEWTYGFGYAADLYASLTAAFWRGENGYSMLSRIAGVSCFREAWQRASKAAREDDSLPPVSRAADPAGVFRECFSDTVTEAVVREYLDLSISG